MGQQITKRPSNLDAPRRTMKICSSSWRETQRSEHNTSHKERMSCQTHGFVHGMPASNVTTTPDGNNRGARARRLRSAIAKVTGKVW